MLFTVNHLLLMIQTHGKQSYTCKVNLDCLFFYMEPCSAAVVVCVHTALVQVWSKKDKQREIGRD